MRTMTQLIREWKEEKKVHNFEGVSGVRNFEKLCSALGYHNGVFIIGDAIWNFLADNSGAIEAIIEWMEEREDESMKENLEAELPEREDSEEDED